MTKQTRMSLVSCEGQRRFIFSVAVLLLAASLRLWQISHTPPGLYIDEAFHLMEAQSILKGGPWPAFITGNNGYEPLFVYVAAGGLFFFGPLTWGSRLIAAWVGLIGVAATIRAGRELFPRSGTGVWAGLVLAVLFWGLTASRFGSQPILAPAAAAGSLAAFWRGARKRDWRAFLTAGICLGLGLDGYLAFRLFPLALLIAGLAAIIAWPVLRRTTFWGGMLTAAVAAAVYSPLALFFIQNPQWFFVRFQQTAAPVFQGSEIALNLLRTIGGLFWQGDANWRQNLPGRPALDAAQALFLLVGVGVCLKRWRQPESWALLAALGVGLLPTVLTTEAPHFGRTTMALPAVALVVAMGIEVVCNRSPQRVVRGLVTAALLVSASLTINDFFGRWAHASELGPAFSEEQVQLAHTVEAAVSAPAALYVSRTTLRDADPFGERLWTLEYLLSLGTFKQVTAFDGEACHVWPARTETDTVYLTIEDPPTVAQVEKVYPALRPIGHSPHVNAYYLPAGQTAQLPVAHLLRARFGQAVEIAGYTLTPSVLVPGQSLQLQVIWKIDHPLPKERKVFVHLLGTPKADGSPIYAQRDQYVCVSSYTVWNGNPGEEFLDTYSLPLPGDLPTGDYLLNIGWYDPASGARWPVFDATDQPAGDTLTLEHLNVPSP